MSKRVRKGYCRDCQANVDHVRRFVSSLAWLLDHLSFRFISRFRLGSWHCLQCTRNSIYLNLPRADARTIQIGRSASPESNENQVESAGNFLRSEQSLIAKKQRLSRFSPKYRENVVQKILAGHVTIGEMCRELDLSEADIIEWFAELFENQSNKIQQLKDLVMALGPNGMGPNGTLQRIDASEEMSNGVIEPQSTKKPFA